MSVSALSLTFGSLVLPRRVSSRRAPIATVPKPNVSSSRSVLLHSVRQAENRPPRCACWWDDTMTRSCTLPRGG